MGGRRLSIPRIVSVVMTHTCPSCGATGIPEDALVCSCGAPLADDVRPEVLVELIPPDAEPPHIDAPPSADRSRRRVVRYGIGVMVSVLVAVMVVISSRGDFDALPGAIPGTSSSTPQAPLASTATSTIEPTTSSSVAASTSTTTALRPPPQVILPTGSTPVVPEPVATLLRDTAILDYDDFTEESDRWSLDGFAGRWEMLPDRIIVGTRTTIGGGGLLSNFAVEPGTAVMFRASYSVRTKAQALLVSGAVGDSGYRRFGLRMGAEPDPDAVVTEHYEGAVEITGLVSLPDLVLEAGHEYYVMFAVEEGGTFALGVWPVDGDGSAIEIRDFGASWARRSWAVHIGVREGILNVFEFWMVQFSSIG